jgi:NAD(P)-dependent dehydrogenase (short-subunit alcohol dehydrogenase family)
MENTKVAVITGGTGGLGQAVTQTFLHTGYQVIITYRDDEELKQLLESVGEAKEQLDAVRVDVTDESSLEELAAKVEKKHGRLDAVVCLVGGFAMGTLGKPGENISQTFDKMMTLNAKSFLLTVSALSPLLQQTTKKYKGFAHVVAVAARPALEPTKGVGIYAASKAAVVSLVKTLALELFDDNITVNAVAPSTIDTLANRKAMPKADFKKWVKPEELAQSILFLSGDEANITTGTVLPVYGKA